MNPTTRIHAHIRLSLFGFFAGFLATLTFHQFALWLLHMAAIAPFAPYNMAATWPWDVPAVLSLAFWGGVWGVILAFFQGRFPTGIRYWAAAFFFGAVFPSLVALFIVLPLKGHALNGSWQLLSTAFLINGVWGLGTVGLLRWMGKTTQAHGNARPECQLGMICS